MSLCYCWDYEDFQLVIRCCHHLTSTSLLSYRILLHSENKLAVKIQSIKGMHDILPEISSYWQLVERKICNVFEQYGYRELRTPIVEKTELFKHSIGELTDIVSKEMYTFNDRSGDSLTLRPEATASCARAGLQHSLFQNSVSRLWYMGPMFRREKPQKGRTRQFHQAGAESFGLVGPDTDAEIIMMCARIWKELDIKEFTLQLNTLGTVESRSKYREALIEYFNDNYDKLDEDDRNRLNQNPLRILDSKNHKIQTLIKFVPVMSDYLDDESSDHFARLKELLSNSAVDFEINPNLVRGLDYYTKTVFEWTTERLGAQGTVCAGGRYDGLVEIFGGKPTPGIGFALGMERLVEVFMESTQEDLTQKPDIYILSSDDKALANGLKIAEQIRDLTTCSVLMHCGGGSFKSQFKKADKSGAKIALILGEEELGKDIISIKYLRQDKDQIEIQQRVLIETLKNEFP